MVRRPAVRTPDVDGAVDLLRLAASSAGLANVGNNLPAYLALEPAAHDATRVLALLIGVNVASGLTWWGSVATLLWRERLRREEAQPAQQKLWGAAAKNWQVVSQGAGVALTGAHLLPTELVKKVTDVGRSLIGADNLPQYQPELGKGGKSRGRLAGRVGDRYAQTTGIYLPACVNTMFGPQGGGKGGGGGRVQTTEYLYYASFAVALCEGGPKVIVSTAPPSPVSPPPSVPPTRSRRSLIWA